MGFLVSGPSLQLEPGTGWLVLGGLLFGCGMVGAPDSAVGGENSMLVKQLTPILGGSLEAMRNCMASALKDPVNALTSGWLPVMM